MVVRINDLRLIVSALVWCMTNLEENKWDMKSTDPGVYDFTFVNHNDAMWFSLKYAV